MKTYPRGNGYLAVYLPSHHRASTNGLVYEHIVVAEKKLGRKLRDGEAVHHEDENRHNNSEDNLFIFATADDHNRFHATGVRLLVDDYYISPPILKDCECCGKSFKTTTSHDGTFCSTECSSKSQRRTERPTKEELYEMIKTKSFIQIGEYYGVSDNAIRKWCKAYELPYRKKDLKQI
jgi:hypothetical protein